MVESVYCTILSKSRLYQFLALIISISHETKDNFSFYVLCVDRESYQFLKKLGWKNITLYFHEDELNEQIVLLKKERKLHEYCWTLKASLMETIFLKNPTVKRVTYMDSDLYFWKDPETIFQNQPNSSVLLIKEEKYNPEWQKVFIQKLTEITGKYNSGFVSFKRDTNSLACLKWWKEKSIESCTINPKELKFGDQKYLDEMPKLFENVHEITTFGVNIGPWNYRKYHFLQKKNEVLINNKPLIFYHFSGIRILNSKEIKMVHNKEENIPFVYQNYKEVLRKALKMAHLVDPEFNGFATKDDLKSYW